jgi:hypothetical protein
MMTHAPDRMIRHWRRRRSTVASAAHHRSDPGRRRRRRPVAGIVAIVLTALSAGPAWAGQTRNDFAYGFTVDLEGDSPLWQLSVPDEVYRKTTRADLADVRVFDRNDKIVPHLVRRPPALLADRPAPRQLAVFPLHGPAGASASGRRLRVVTNERGEVVRVFADDLPRGAADRIVAYLIDVGRPEQMPDRLELAWTAAGTRGFAVTVDLESSDDLSRWRTVVAGVTLADLSSEGAALVHREIDLPQFDARYLRIDWPAALSGVELTRVDASFPAPQQAPAHRTLEVVGVPAGGTPQAYEFDAEGMRPVDQVRVLLAERNAVFRADILSRSAPGDDWRRRHSGTFYRLERDGTSVQSAPAQFAATTDRYWRLEIASGQSWTGGPPTFELRWVPDVLTAVAQGERPFTVAFGRAAAEPAVPVADGLLGVIQDEQGRALIGGASASDVVALGGESRLVPPAPPLPWRTWILWSVLVCGVGLLGWMVRQLAMGMRSS